MLNGNTCVSAGYVFTSPSANYHGANNAILHSKKQIHKTLRSPSALWLSSVCPLTNLFPYPPYSSTFHFAPLSLSIIIPRRIPIATSTSAGASVTLKVPFFSSADSPKCNSLYYLFALPNWPSESVFLLSKHPFLMSNFKCPSLPHPYLTATVTLDSEGWNLFSLDLCHLNKQLVYSVTLLFPSVSHIQLCNCFILSLFNSDLRANRKRMFSQWKMRQNRTRVSSFESTQRTGHKLYQVSNV